MIFGILSGVAFATGWAAIGGIIAAVSQVLDGVDGQFARLTGKQSAAGAFLDSVLDRYSDGALVIGLSIYCVTTYSPLWLMGVLGATALTSSGLISYSSARAESLGIPLGTPTLASKGTRTTVVALSGILSLLSSFMPLVAMCYLVIHTTAVVVYRIIVVHRLPLGSRTHS